jgi:hypothetical protein
MQPADDTGAANDLGRMDHPDNTNNLNHINHLSDLDDLRISRVLFDLAVHVCWQGCGIAGGCLFTF